MAAALGAGGLHNRPPTTSPGRQAPAIARMWSLFRQTKCRLPATSAPNHHDLSLTNRCICQCARSDGSSFPYDGRSSMEFVDRLLTCADCGGEFIFTAGEQLFFLDKQFKNDPKRCKPCKSRRSAQTTAATTGGPAAAGISRTETRTECSECGITTTVPFKPTQGRPVLCRQCFKSKRPLTASPSEPVTTPVELAADAPTIPAIEHAQAPAELRAAAQPSLA
jgi:CxxC-x17-CxxC domain-containing protein